MKMKLISNSIGISCLLCSFLIFSFSSCRDKETQVKEPCDKRCNYICKDDYCECPPGYFQIPTKGGAKEKFASCLKDTGQILKASTKGTAYDCVEVAYIDDLQRLSWNGEAKVVGESMGLIRFSHIITGTGDRQTGIPITPEKYKRGEEYDEFETGFTYVNGMVSMNPVKPFCKDYGEYLPTNVTVDGRYYHKQNILDVRILIVRWDYGRWMVGHVYDSCHLRFTR